MRGDATSNDLLAPGDSSRAAYMRERYGGHLQRWVHRREAQLLRRLLERVGSVESILDVPSGHGRWAPMLRAIARREVCCCDVDEGRLAALREAEASATPASPAAALRTERVDLRAPLAFADRSFDLVFHFRYLHHVADPAARARILGELARVARRYLLLSWYGEAPLHRLEKHLWRAVTRRRGRIAMAPAGEVAGRLSELGFRCVAERAIFPLLHAQRVGLFERTAPAPG